MKPNGTLANKLLQAVTAVWGVLQHRLSLFQIILIAYSMHFIVNNTIYGLTPLQWVKGLLLAGLSWICSLLSNIPFWPF